MAEHELYRQWVALESGETSSGFLLLSVAVIGPGERLAFHDRAKVCPSLSFVSDPSSRESLI